MATTPNAQLAKLAIGIASVAAVAGISGKIAAQPPVAAQQDQTTSVAAAGNAATGRTRSGALSDGGQQVQSPTFSGFGDDDEAENEHESEHDGARSFFGTAPTQPQSGSSGTFTQAPQTQQQQTRRTRSKHS